MEICGKCEKQCDYTPHWGYCPDCTAKAAAEDALIGFALVDTAFEELKKALSQDPLPQWLQELPEKDRAKLEKGVKNARTLTPSLPPRLSACRKCGNICDNIADVRGFCEKCVATNAAKKIQAGEDVDDKDKETLRVALERQPLWVRSIEKKELALLQGRVAEKKRVQV